MTQYPTLGQILLLVLLAAFLAPLLVGSIAGLYSLQGGLIAAECSIICFMALFIRRHRMVPEDLLLLNATPPTTLLATGATALCATLLIADFDLLCSELLAILDFRLPLTFQRYLLEIQLVHDLPGLGLVLAGVVLAPALCEEFFFRGLVFTGLYVHHGTRAAVLGSSLLFAVVHFSRPLQFPAFFLFGLFLAALVYWTHSIYPAVLAHAINNLVSTVGINLKIHLGLDALGFDQHLPLPVTGIALAVLVGGLLFLRWRPSIVSLPTAAN